jgi:hypothetical protein
VNSNRRSRRVEVVAGSESLISSAGGSLLAQTAAVSGLDRALGARLAPWRAARARHDPGKVVLDLAVAIALAGDCLADLAVVRAQPDVFGEVASDPTVSRLITALAADAPAALAAPVRRPRPGLAAPGAGGRERAGDHRSGRHDRGSAHQKEGATPTWKRTFGFHPLLAFLDHGPGGTGEPVAGLLRTGRGTANNAADHIRVLTDALAQLPAEHRGRVLVRGNSGAGVHAFVHHVHALGLQYSVGLYAHQPVLDALAVLPRQAWKAALDPDGRPRAGAQVAELTRRLRPARAPWPPGMRVIARRERPHPGAQLRLTDADGWRITLFASNVRGGRITDLEVQHRLRARAEGRIRCLKDTGLRNLPLHDFAANQIWLELVALARGPARLDPAPRPGRHPRPNLGTQTAATAAAQHRRRHHPNRPPPPAAITPRLALGRSPAARTAPVSTR